MPSIPIPTVPVHIGLIMDGNGRWAQKLNKARTFGHSEGLKAAKKIVKYASEIGVQHLTLYTFSTENWKRTEEEVGFLMQLIHTHLKKEMNFYRKNKIRVRLCGALEGLPPALQKEIKEVISDTADFTGLTVTLAINYGGRDELTRAVNRVLKNGITTITEQMITDNLDNPDIPDPDLIIRTAGEQRLSNFLIWEAAYSEYWFTPTLWPDFSPVEMDQAIAEYNQRKRKFGGVK